MTRGNQPYRDLGKIIPGKIIRQDLGAFENLNEFYSQLEQEQERLVGVLGDIEGVDI